MSPLVALLAAAGVGFSHAVLPDHWIPLAVVSRTQRYSVRRTVRLSAAAAITHVLVSVVLGGLLIAVGLRFRSIVQRDEDLVVGGLLALTGVVVLILELAGRSRPAGHGHSHDDHPHDHHRTDSPARRRLTIVLPFGAAASPDLTILPVFLAASAISAVAAIGAVVVFALATMVTVIGLTVLAAVGVWRLRGIWLDRYANLVTGLTLLGIGLFIGLGG